MIEREEYGLSVKTAELAKEDNLQLAPSAAQIVTAFGQLHDKGLIGDADLLDLSYRFAGELVDVEAMLEQAGLGPHHSGGMPRSRQSYAPCSWQSPGAVGLLLPGSS